ncbi:hypothetical protein L218DRAFT_1073872 [Marasmius fiardii PR-910]|nr:hypothetical protein L218DRAFT_1073872 [Marasmius fiardii PR-910]
MSSSTPASRTPPHILRLPTDALILILRELSISSLLSVQQTCRVLHALCSSDDYIWHTINLDLPLNVAPHVSPQSLPGSELRQLAVNALRIDHNWGRRHTVLRRIQHVHHGGIISEMRLLSSEWLVTLSRTSTGGASVLSVWNIRQSSSTNRVQAVVLEALHSPKLATCFQNAGTELLVAVYFCSASRRELLRVYNFPLAKSGADGLPDSRYLVSQLSGKNIQGTAFEAHIFQSIVAVGLAQFDNGFDPPRYRILLADINTGFYYLAHIHGSEELSQMHFRLFPGLLFVTGIHQGNLVFLKYDITHLAFTSSEDVQLGPPIEEFISPVKITSSPGFDYTLSAENFSRSLTSMTALTYHQTPTFRHIITFPLKRTHQRDVLAHTLPSTSASAIDIICVGHSGQRAVWLERRWDTDAFVLMKGSFPSGSDRKPSVSTLVPPHTALPFEFHACQSLAFDEATGRVCVGLHTGDLYLLDF